MEDSRGVAITSRTDTLNLVVGMAFYLIVLSGFCASALFAARLADRVARGWEERGMSLGDGTKRFTFLMFRVGGVVGAAGVLLVALTNK